jgi:hypothetical protein
MRSVEAGDHLYALLHRAGLDAAHLDVWEAWKVFKAFVREPSDSPEDGITVQAVSVRDPGGADRVYLRSLRQFSVLEAEEDTPVGYVGLEFAFAGQDMTLSEDLELWSYDFPSLADFAATVEQHPVFQRALVTRPMETEVIIGEA